MAGGRAGSLGQRGSLFEVCVRRIIHLRPKLFILENVVGLLSIEKGAFLSRMLKMLSADGNYRDAHRVINTADHGLPHHRWRVYIAGFLGSLAAGDFGWPDAVGHLDLEEILDDRPAGSYDHAHTGVSRLWQRNVASARRRLEDVCVADRSLEHVIDVDCSERYLGLPKRVSPCLLHSRGRGYWLLRRNRRLSAVETARLQGIGHSALVVKVSDSAYRSACGNAMWVNVLTRLLARLLVHVGLTGPLTDPWDLVGTEDCTTVAFDKAFGLPCVRASPGVQPVHHMLGHVERRDHEEHVPETLAHFKRDEDSPESDRETAGAAAGRPLTSWVILGEIGRAAMSLGAEGGFGSWAGPLRERSASARQRDIYPVPVGFPFSCLGITVLEDDAVLDALDLAGGLSSC